MAGTNQSGQASVHKQNSLRAEWKGRQTCSKKFLPRHSAYKADGGKSTQSAAEKIAEGAFTCSSVASGRRLTNQPAALRSRGLRPSQPNELAATMTGWRPALGNLRLDWSVQPRLSTDLHLLNCSHVVAGLRSTRAVVPSNSVFAQSLARIGTETAPCRESSRHPRAWSLFLSRM